MLSLKHDKSGATPTSSTGMKRNKSNCLFWAVKKWMKDGGYLCFRISRHRHWFPIRLHVLWHPEDPNDNFEHYTTDKDLGRFPPPIFRGYVKRGDNITQEDD